MKIMQNTASKYELKHYDMVINDELLFFVNGSEENLNDFALALQTEVPLSLYFILKSVEVAKDMSKDYSNDIIKNTSTFDFSINEINEIKDLESPNFCDIFNYPKFKVDFDIFYKDKKIDTRDIMQKVLFDICNMLQNNETISLQTIKGRISISLNSDNFDYIMANGMSNIALYTRASKDEMDALATFEKPCVSLLIKELFVKDLGFKRALFVLPYDIILYIVANILLKKDIPFVYIKNTSNSTLTYDVPFKDNFFEIIVGNRGYFIHNNYIDSKETEETVCNLLDSNFIAENAMFVSYLSTNHKTIFGKLYNNQIDPVLNISFDKNPKNILKELLKRKNGDKLINNFKKSFFDRFERIEALDDTPQQSNNIVDILDSVSFILGFELDKNKIFELADLYLRDIGPKIDFKNININGEIFYDHILTIRSIMSFSIAGVEIETLGYGVLESLVDYLILIFRDVDTNYSIKDIGIIGNMFANKIIFDKLTKKFPLDFNLIFPNYLDFKS
ncbi:hypothetical protein [Helicobacter sp. MIT 14-3879]|uniref:hypothetical protein n=1 Tax=Helicobacter sp. MIT 14-3879 TaxID=2040649 RepID=UPI0015F1A22F|nr:hypothetical protein [Helicobacter sp. MIT 14-3879]